MQQLCFFTGFMGAGKSYWGRRLSERLNLPFVDLDVQIEIGENSPITNIFKNAGEQTFRELERAYLHQTLAQAPAVVAVGGGAPCFFDNMDWMNQHGLTVWLNPPVAALASRLYRESLARPLLLNVPQQELQTYIAGLLEKRKPYYELAQMEIDSSLPDEKVLVLLETRLRDFFKTGQDSRLTG